MVITGMVVHSVIAQNFLIQGQVFDTLNLPLPSATVMLLNPVDSSLVNFTVSDAQGRFELKSADRKEYIFKVSFTGFSIWTRKLLPPEGGSVTDLGKIRMEPENNQLGEVVVEAEKIPVIVKKDTIEYNAGSFKTRPNDNVEGLLKKLPGVEVDTEGTITAQGEEVKRVTVDGKEFFGRDPKLATRNLPADAVDKVQVYDKKSDQAEFTGIDDGQREKAINLELKEDRRHSVFGNVTGGAGTDDRFQVKANINRFNKGDQLSFLGMANNINEQGFSIDEYMNFTGASQQMAAGGGPVRINVNLNDQSTGIPVNFGRRANGIMTSYATGLNLNNQLSKKTEVNGNYFFNSLAHDLEQETYRENFLPDGNFTYNQNSIQNSQHVNHRANAIIDHQLDSLNSLRFTTNFSFNGTDSEQQSTASNRAADSTLQNESEIRNTADGNSTTSSSSLLFRHKFDKKGRTLSSNLTLGVSRNDRDGYTDGIYRYFGGQSREEIQKQSSEQTIGNLNYGANITYTEPLGGRKYLEANYAFNQNHHDSDRDVYDQLDGESRFNPQLSTEYNSDYTYHKGGLNFRLNRYKFNLQAGSSLQYTSLEGELKSLESEVDRSFKNILPVVRFNYDFTETRHLSFDYETSVQEPSIQQLNPALDQTDQLNLYQGNPNLRPAYTHNWRVGYNMFNPMKFFHFSGLFDVNYTTHAITNAVSYENFVRLTMPVNVDYSLKLLGNFSVFFPVKPLNSRFSVIVRGQDQKSITILNDLENTVHQRNYEGVFRYSYRLDEVFDLNLNASLRKNTASYEFDQPDQSFLNQTYTAEASVSLLRNYQFVADFNYYVYSDRKNDFKEDIPVLNLSLSQFLLKNKKGELKLSVNNLLDEATGVTQTANSNYLERQITNSLGRYFMISFTYMLNKHLNPTGQRKGEMIRIGG